MSGDVHGEGAQILTELDAVGNTTKAITKGIAISTAVLAATALFGSYTDAIRTVLVDSYNAFETQAVVFSPPTLVGIILGASVVFLFSGLAISAVGRAAGAVVYEVRRQFREIPGIMEGTGKPEYGKVVDICTRDSLRELATPGLLALLAPIAVGFGLGAPALAGYLAGAIACGTLMAVFLANSGGSWDNAKKLVEDGHHGGKGSEAHAATVIGDTVGDPFKDTAGPAINPLIKVMNLVAVLIAPAVVALSPLSPTPSALAVRDRARRPGDRDRGGRREHPPTGRHRRRQPERPARSRRPRDRRRDRALDEPHRPAATVKPDEVASRVTRSGRMLHVRASSSSLSAPFGPTGQNDCTMTEPQPPAPRQPGGWGSPGPDRPGSTAGPGDGSRPGQPVVRTGHLVAHPAADASRGDAQPVPGLAPAAGLRGARPAIRRRVRIRSRLPVRDQPVPAGYRRSPTGYQPLLVPVVVSALPDGPRTYPQMLRGPRRRWWRPLVALLLAGAHRARRPGRGVRTVHRVRRDRHGWPWPRPVADDRDRQALRCRHRRGRLPLHQPEPDRADPGGWAVDLGRAPHPAEVRQLGGRRVPLALAVALPGRRGPGLGALHRARVPDRPAGVRPPGGVGGAALPGRLHDPAAGRRRGVLLPRLDPAERRLVVQAADAEPDRRHGGVRDGVQRRARQPGSVDPRQPRPCSRSRAAC